MQESITKEELAMLLRLSSPTPIASMSDNDAFLAGQLWDGGLVTKEAQTFALSAIGIKTVAAAIEGANGYLENRNKPELPTRTLIEYWNMTKSDFMQAAKPFVTQPYGNTPYTLGYREENLQLFSYKGGATKEGRKVFTDAKIPRLLSRVWLEITGLAEKRNL